VYASPHTIDTQKQELNSPSPSKILTAMSMDSQSEPNLMEIDPGLPRPNGSTPYWLHELHPRADIQSSSLPTHVDVVVIGSGITGLSTANTLLKRHPTIQVTVLEARSICSGATGRNGGNLVAYGGVTYKNIKQVRSQAMATKIVEFTFRNIRQTKDMMKESPTLAKVSEYRELTRIRTFADQSSLDAARQSVAEFVQDNPKYRGLYEFVEDPKTLREQYGLHGVVGAVLFDAAGLWPYRFVMGTWERLLVDFPGRLTLEARTPVISVSHNSENIKFPYIVATQRGNIRASHVVHCTNGYAGHLLPRLRGTLYPFQGVMTVQDFEDSCNQPNQGAKLSWSIHGQPPVSAKDQNTPPSIYYLNQNALSGYYFFGGAEGEHGPTITGDDSQVPRSTVDHLRSKLGAFLGRKPNVENRLISSWSGIMGFTADEDPLVGRLPQSITDRNGKGEWIAAGFNGMGMSLCIASGEAIACLVLGLDVSSWLPEVYGIQEERVHKNMMSSKGRDPALTASL